MTIDKLIFKSRVTHVGEMSRTFESCVPVPKYELKAYKLIWVIQAEKLE